MRAINGIITTTFINLSSDVSGILGITNGGTGITTAPAPGQILIGNSSGGYTLTSTSSLGIQPSWGAITGSILNQTDLQTALNNKLSSSSLPSITTLASLSLPYSQVTGAPTSLASSTLLSDSNTFSGVENFTNNVTLANATATSFSATTASSTNFFATNGYIGTLIADASGASVISTGTNISRTLAARASDVTNVLDYGADPSGQADSAPAFRAAIASNRTIYVPPGTYKFASTESPPCCAFDNASVLVQGKNNFKIDGYGATIIVANSIALSSAFQFDTDSNFSINGLTIQGSRNGLSSGQENVGITISSGVNFSVSDVHFTGNFGGNGSAIAGDWMVDGTFKDIRMDAVGQCADIAFLKNVTLDNIRAYGADTNGNSGVGQTGNKCISITNDVINNATNNTGVSFSETAGVKINNVHETNFSTGAYISSGEQYSFSDNDWYGNPGLGSSKGIGIFLDYANGGSFSSIGVPVQDVTINGDTFANNGSVTAGYGILINTASIANSDAISNVTVEGSVFDNNTSTGIETTSATGTVNTVLEGNTYSGSNQITSVGPILSSIASFTTAGSENFVGPLTLSNNKNLYWKDSSGNQQPIMGLSPTNITFIRPGSAAAYINFQTYSGLPILTALNNGNVGIGTISPSSLLSVAGNAYIGGNLTATGTLTVSGNTALAAATTSNLAISTLGNTLLWANSSGSIVSTSSLGRINNVLFSAGSNITINAASSTLLADNNTFSGSNIFSQSLSLTSTTGTTTVAAGQGFTIGGSQFVVQQGSGNVGIGTSSPNVSGLMMGGGSENLVLAIQSSGAAAINIVNSTTNNTFGLYPENNSGGNFGSVGTVSNNSFAIKTNNTQRIMVLNSGNVGIATTTPNGRLEVDQAHTSPINLALVQPDTTWGSTSLFQAYRFIQTLSNAGDGNFKTFNVGAGGTAIGFSTTPGYGSGDALYVNGNTGIGTTSPSSRLTIWGPDTASTTAFSVVNNASTTVFASYDNGNATYSGSLFQSSDQRLKTNISSLDASSSLSLVEQLDPVSYTRIDQPDQGSTLGFIAQEVQKLFPNLVTMTAATALTPGGTLTLNYTGLIAPLVAAVQALQGEIASIQRAVAEFAQSFTSQTITALTEIDTPRICVTDGGAKTCINQQQLAALLAANAASAGASPSPAGGGAGSGASSTPPVISINGDNPAIIQVGASYSDLGATIIGPAGDTNLGIHTFVNGAPMSPVQLDTSAAATDTIDYVATDQNGLTSTSTRTVIIRASVTQASPDVDLAASSSVATSTGTGN